MAELLGKAYGSVPLDIAAIKQARYGRDVRAAIAEALELINGEIPEYTQWEDVTVYETEVANVGCRCRVSSGLCFINGILSLKKAISVDGEGKTLLRVPASMAPVHQTYLWCVANTGGMGGANNSRAIPCQMLISGHLETMTSLSADEWIGVNAVYPVK